MEVVKLNDGSIEIIGSHRDLVDIVRDRCGDDIAKMVEELDPINYDSLFTANSTIWEIEDIIDGLDEDENLDDIKRKIELVQHCISNCI